MPYMANDNQNQVLDEHTEVIDDEKASAKRARKTKPKASEVAQLQAYLVLHLISRRKMKNTCLKDSLSISAKF
jgi:hypothetical protein